MSATTLRQWRGTVHASLTRLTTRVVQLETKAGEAGTSDLVQQAKLKLQELDSEFKAHHYELLDVLEEEDKLDAEQVIVNTHDDQVAALFVRSVFNVSQNSPVAGLFIADFST